MKGSVEYSKVEPSYSFDESSWVVSVINGGGKDIEGTLLGHSILMIEGVHESRKFIRQIDIRAVLFPLDRRDPQIQSQSSFYRDIINPKGYISQIRIFHAYAPDKDYSQLGSQQWIVTRAQGLKVVEVAEREKRAVEEYDPIDPKSNFVPYQQVGETSWASELGRGENCADFCIRIMKAAGVEVGDPKPKPVVVANKPLSKLTSAARYTYRNLTCKNILFWGTRAAPVAVAAFGLAYVYMNGGAFDNEGQNDILPTAD